MHVEIYYILVKCDHDGPCAGNACAVSISPVVHSETMWLPSYDAPVGTSVPLQTIGNLWTRLGPITRKGQDNTCALNSCRRGASVNLTNVRDAHAQPNTTHTDSTCYMHETNYEHNPFGFDKHMYRKIFVKAVAIR